MRLVLRYIKQHKKLLFWALFFAAINQIASLMDPYIFQFIVDDYLLKVGELSQDVYIKGVIGLFLLAMLAALVSRIAKNIQEYLVTAITEKVGTAMYADSVKHTFSLPFLVFEDKRSGEILQKMQKARDDTKLLIQNMIAIVYLSGVGIIFVLVYSFIVHYLIGVTFALIIPLLAYITYLLSRRIKKAQKEIVQESGELSGATTETLRNVELVKSLGLEAQEIKRLNVVNDKILDLELKKAKQIRTLTFLQGTTINFLRTAVLTIILFLIFQGEVSAGQFFTLMFYSFFIFTPLSNLGVLAAQYQQAKASTEALDEILSLPPTKKKKDAKVIKDISDIQFEKVDFSYATNGHASLKNINLTIKKGETIAFAGQSGSGKSTLMKLLVGLYEPSRGRILFNKEANVDQDEIRKRIGLVSQETQLFAGTIRENLLFVNPKATNKRCMEALQMASIDSLVTRGDKGLDTRIGENGIKLSGGEKQRLAIARALLRDPDIIIFDEATSSLDSVTEKEITKTIKKIAEHKPELIVILIAHRLSTITHSDCIYVLDKGNIVESGNHDQLLRKSGLYADYWKEQSRK